MSNINHFFQGTVRYYQNGTECTKPFEFTTDPSVVLIVGVNLAKHGTVTIQRVSHLSEEFIPNEPNASNQASKLMTATKKKCIIS